MNIVTGFGEGAGAALAGRPSRNFSSGALIGEPVAMGCSEAR